MFDTHIGIIYFVFDKAQFYLLVIVFWNWQFKGGHVKLAQFKDISL